MNETDEPQASVPPEPPKNRKQRRRAASIEKKWRRKLSEKEKADLDY